MKTLKDRYLDAVVPRDPGPRPRAGYSLWQRYWAALTGTRLSPKPRLRPEKGPTGNAEPAPAGRYGAARRRILLASVGSALAVVVGGTLFISAVQTPATAPPEPGPSRPSPQGTQASPPPEPIAIARDLMIRPTAAGVGIDLANGRVSSTDAGDIGFYYDDGWMYVDELTSTVATLDVTQSAVSYQTCVNTLGQLANHPTPRPTDPRPPVHSYTGQGLCVETLDGGTAFVGLAKPLGADKVLHLRVTYWP